MHTQHHIEAPRSVEPVVLDDHDAKPHRGMAGEEPRSPADAFGESFGYRPNCVHGMNSFADERYDLALARLRRG